MLASEFKIGQLIYDSIGKFYYVPVEIKPISLPHGPVFEVVVFNITRFRTEHYNIADHVVERDYVVCETLC
jgi:hypothetical protein